jgi:hypothetical protein
MPKKPDGVELLSKITGRYINVVRCKNSGLNEIAWVCTLTPKMYHHAQKANVVRPENPSDIISGYTGKMLTVDG